MGISLIDCCGHRDDFNSNFPAILVESGCLTFFTLCVRERQGERERERERGSDLRGLQSSCYSLGDKTLKSY